jgi:hypothetical protein
LTVDDPIDAHRALQKAARELAFYADHGYEAEYRDTIDRLEAKLQPLIKQRMNMATLAEDIAALAKDEKVMWAVGVLRKRGINGVMYDKLISMTNADDELRDQATSHIESLLSEVYEPEGVRIWMTSPHQWFKGKSAIEMIAAGRSNEVLAAVNILIDGAFA